jgi:1-deoxy-D-xylulose-5-phosphate synthase
VRYPRGNGFGVPMDPDPKTIPIGEAEILRDGDDAVVVALGTVAHAALEAAAELAADDVSVAVVNARFAKPLDAERIARLARRCGRVVTVEEHSGMGGFGSAVLEALAAAGVQAAVRTLAIPDRLVEHAAPDALRAELGLDAGGIARALRELLALRPR